MQTKRGAEAHERVLRSEFQEDEDSGRNPFEGQSPTFADFSERWIRDYAMPYNRPTSVREKRSYLRHHLVPAFGTLRLDEISTERIDRFVAGARTRLRPKTLNNILTVLRCCLSLAHEWGQLRRVPRVRGVRVPYHSFRVLTDEELNKLIDAAPTPRWRIFIALLADTGLRFGEGAGLLWDAVHLDDPAPHINVIRAAAAGVLGPTKTGRSRVVPLTQRAQRVLLSLGRQGPVLFPKRDGGLLRPECTLKILHRACDRAGVQRIGWHDLRHTYATRLCQRGVPLPNVQALLGHTTIVMTSRYAHESDLAGSVRRALDAHAT